MEGRFARANGKLQFGRNAPGYAWRMAGDEGTVFDRVAEIYDRARPTYPRGLFEAVGAYVSPPIHALEVAPGTGQATVGLLPLCKELTCVEKGRRMSAILRAKFARDPRVRVLPVAFEDAILPDAGFDLAFCATAFHWLDPTTRMARFARVIRPGGALAIVHTIQVASDADRGYFGRSADIYRRYNAHNEGEVLDPPGQATPSELPEIVASPGFAALELHRFRWDQRYETEAYLELVQSYSTTASMTSDAADGLLRDLRELIDSEFGGYVVRPLVITLVLTRRVAGGL